MPPLIMPMPAVFFLILSIVFSLSSTAKPVLNATNMRQLAESPYWLKLGHYLPRPLLMGWKSTIDSQDFFLADTGKNDPLAELEATFNAIYHQDAAIRQSSRCQYPARFLWLDRQLQPNLDDREAAQKIAHCHELKQWQYILNPDTMTLVFPTAYMNNPSSAFGHTLLRVNAIDQTRNKELVAFAINFAAEPDPADNAALFAIKGLIGQYPGQFAVMPYYRKVREYNDIESRDIWEFPLQLSRQEVTRVLWHLWELKSAQFDYYFVDENCSYQLLSLLQLAREDLDLVSQFPLYAIPSDTVTALEQVGLLDSPRYRASQGTRLIHQSQEFDSALLPWVEQLKAGQSIKDSPLSEAQKVAVYEFTYQWYNFEFYQEGLARQQAAKHMTKWLTQRAKLSPPSPFTPVTIPDVSPLQGHGSRRVGLGVKHAQDNETFLLFDWRLAYHDLLDNSDGFIPGAQLSFLDSQWALSSSDSLSLERLDLMNIWSIATSDDLFNNLAWHLHLGFDRLPGERTQRDGRLHLKGSGGQTINLTDNVVGYALFGGEVAHGSATEHKVQVALGAEIGMLWQMTNHHTVKLSSEHFYALQSTSHHRHQVSLDWHWTLSQHWAIRSSYQWQQWQTDQQQWTSKAYFYY